VAKKIRFESFVYRLLAEADSVHRLLPAPQREAWGAFVAALHFQYSQGRAVVSWHGSSAGKLEFPLNAADLYHRGDTARYVEEQRGRDLLHASDQVQRRNAAHFQSILREIAGAAGIAHLLPPPGAGGADAARLRNEEEFHDRWASSEDAGDIDVVTANETCTSPEMRFIRDRLGDLTGKRLLDVGCGLGEASVYFAIKGAQVTAMDLSQGMLDATKRLAERNGVAVATHKAAAESTNLPPDAVFDVIYAGNLLHHVDIESTVKLLKPHLAAGGMFVSWDPLAYNPAINVYRAMATEVRTPDEHPLTWKDIRLFRREFAQVTTNYFWLTTLVIFVIMVLVQRRNPNKERLWKVVVRESRRWEWLYRPLEKLDAVLLAVLPPLRLLCWNVVIVAKAPLASPS